MAPQDHEVVTVDAPSSDSARTEQPDGNTKQRRHWTVSLLLGAAVLVSLLVAAMVSKIGTGDEPTHVREHAPRSLAAANATFVGNPFHGQVFYKNPANQKSYDDSIATAKGKVKRNLLKMREVPSAYWIDVKAKIHGTSTSSLEGILADASSKATPELVTFIWYDLPNRDCHAKASNGEICCSYNADRTCDYSYQSDCSAGLREYKTTYADPFVEVLQQYAGRVPIVVVIEPDSLPNLATNADDPRCGGAATREAYTKGIKYSIEQLTRKVPEVAVYLDAAHGGWLGWQDNLIDFMRMLRRMDLPFNKMRGFATNVANYQPLGAMCPHQPDSGYRNGFCLNGRNRAMACCADPCGLARDWSAGNNELNYAQELAVAAKAVLGMNAHMVIDTGRNGQTEMRQACKHWCNIRDAGAGIASTTRVASPKFVDAYFWLKTPGESDGCTEVLPSGGLCPRFDSDCSSVDSLGSDRGEPRAPEAGHWFDYQVKQLAKYAVLE